ncbi:hypothetical protein GCM10027027_12040 [Neomicrococcus lactis]
MGFTLLTEDFVVGAAAFVAVALVAAACVLLALAGVDGAGRVGVGLTVAFTEDDAAAAVGAALCGSMGLFEESMSGDAEALAFT